MIRPTAGLRCFHEGTPVEFLYLIESTAASERWLCKPLFIAKPENKDRVWRRGDRITLLHTQQP